MAITPSRPSLRGVEKRLAVPEALGESNDATARVHELAEALPALGEWLVEERCPVELEEIEQLDDKRPGPRCIRAKLGLLLVQGTDLAVDDTVGAADRRCKAV